MLDLSLPDPIEPAPSAPKRSIRLVEAAYQPMRPPPASEIIRIEFKEDNNNDSKSPSIRILGGSLAPPHRKHEFVRNREIKGMQKGLKVRVSHGELFSQFDVQLWMHLVNYLLPNNWDGCINARELLRRRGIANPSGGDYVQQKISIMRFARTLIEIAYTGKGEPFHYTGSLIAVGDYAEGEKVGAVYYDDLRAEKCGGDGYLGRLDRFSVHIRPEIAAMLQHKQLRLIVDVDKQSGITTSRPLTEFESWVSLKILPFAKIMGETRGFDTPLSKMMKDYESTLNESKFETMAKSAFEFLVENGWAKSFEFYTSETGQRRVVISALENGARVVKHRIEAKAEFTKKAARLRGDRIN